MLACLLSSVYITMHARMDVHFFQLHNIFCCSWRSYAIAFSHCLHSNDFHQNSPTIENVAIGHQLPAQPTHTEDIQLINA
jgi:hypothetical protein